MTKTKERDSTDVKPEDNGGLTPIDMDPNREKTLVAADAPPSKIITWQDQQSE